MSVYRKVNLTLSVADFAAALERLGVPHERNVVYHGWGGRNMTREAIVIRKDTLAAWAKTGEKDSADIAVTENGELLHDQHYGSANVTMLQRRVFSEHARHTIQDRAYAMGLAMQTDGDGQFTLVNDASGVTVVIKVNDNGQLSLTVNGVDGPACSPLATIVTGMGEMVGEGHTDDYFKTPPPDGGDYATLLIGL
jgi:hypothetical protein